LAADTALLEREYVLDQSGFQRNESRTPRVIIYGGNGFFGRIVVEELLRHTTARIEIASRTAHKVKYPGFESRLQFIESDLQDLGSVQRVIAGGDLVIVTAGPFQGMPVTALQACIAEGVPYIDVADDRDFVCRAYALAESKTIPSGSAFQHLWVTAPATGWWISPTISFSPGISERRLWSSGSDQS